MEMNKEALLTVLGFAPNNNGKYTHYIIGRDNEDNLIEFDFSAASNEGICAIVFLHAKQFGIAKQQKCFLDALGIPNITEI